MAHESATPRPWSLEDGNPLTIVADQGDDYPWFIATAHEGMRETKANAALIVEAVNAFDTLRAEVARLEAENAKLRTALRVQFCPRPINGRPCETDIGVCVDAGECGCAAVGALTGDAA